MQVLRAATGPHHHQAAPSTRGAHDEIQQALDYLEENPEADLSEAYLKPYDRRYKDSVKAVDSGAFRLNSALMLGLATLHPLAGYALGTTTGLGMTALGGLELAEGLKSGDSHLKKAGLLNMSIGLVAAGTPFVAGFPWYARVAPLGLLALKEIWLKAQDSRPTFTLPPALPKNSNSPAVAASIPVAAARPLNQDQRLERALRNLAGAGWSFQAIRGEEGFLQPLDAQEARSYFAGQRRSGLRDGDRLLLLEPGHTSFQASNWHHVVDLEGVAAVDFFHGSGDSQVLSDPELGQALKALDQMGVEMSPPHARYRFHRGPAATYMSYQRNFPSSMSLGGLALASGPVDADQVRDLKALTGMNEAQRQKFLESRLVGASARQALDSLKPPRVDVEVEENTLTIGGFTVEIKE